MDLLFLFTIVPAYLVGSFFIKHDPGPEEPRSAITSAIWFGVVAIILALILSFGFEFLISGNFLDRVSGAESETPLPLFLDVLIFATIEEFVKFIPIAVYLLKKDYFNEITDGIIYFAIVGLTFGAIESFLYGFTAGDAGFVVALMRLALGLFFHGALTGVVGYYFAKSKVTNTGLPVAIGALLAVSLVHAAYNFFVFSVQADPIFIFGAAAMALGANAAMFWLYFVAIKKDIALGIAGPQYIQQRQAARNAAPAMHRQDPQMNQASPYQNQPQFNPGMPTQPMPAPPAQPAQPAQPAPTMEPIQPMQPQPQVPQQPPPAQQPPQPPQQNTPPQV
jgi:RsiW-degrading membrane proteinase PrsW (M82 family)